MSRGVSQGSGLLIASVLGKELYVFGSCLRELGNLDCWDWCLVLQQLRDDEPEKYQSNFSQFIKEGVEPESLEALYTKVHAAIRADPSAKLTEKKAPTEKRS